LADQATKDMRRRFTKAAAIFFIIIAVLSGLLIWWFFAAKISLISVQGDSMEPTFHSGDTVVLKQSFQVKKGMIAVFPKPASWDYLGTGHPELVKRIVAGGNSVLFYDGSKLYVDGQMVYDLKAHSYPCTAGPVGYSHKLSQNQIFAMGDNHSVSLDSLRIFCDGHPEDAFIPFKSVVAYGTVERIFK